MHPQVARKLPAVQAYGTVQYSRLVVLVLGLLLAFATGSALIFAYHKASSDQLYRIRDTHGVASLGPV